MTATAVYSQRVVDQVEADVARPIFALCAAGQGYLPSRTCSTELCAAGQACAAIAHA